MKNILKCTGIAFAGGLIALILFSTIVKTPVKSRSGLTYLNLRQVYNRVNDLSASNLTHADYVIEEISGTVYAKPAFESGLTAYSDTNLAAVLEDAMSQITSGGLILIRKGYYDHLPFITIPTSTNIKIRGEGMGVTRLKLKDEADYGLADDSQRGLFQIMNHAVSGLELSDMEWDGNGFRQSHIDTEDGGHDACCDGFNANYPGGSFSYGIFERLYIHHVAKAAITIANGGHSIIRYCRLMNNFWGAGGPAWGSYDDIYHDNYVQFGGSGFDVGGTGSIWIDNIVKDVGEGGGDASGIHGSEASHYSYNIENQEYIEIRGGLVSGDSVSSAISANYVENSVFDGITITGHPYDVTVGCAISLYQDSNVVVQNCFVRGGYAAIGLSGSEYCIIRNNDVATLGSPGIRLTCDVAHVPSTNNYVMNNKSRGSAYGILLDQTYANINNVITGNIAQGNGAVVNDIRDLYGGPNYIYNNFEVSSTGLTLNNRNYNYAVTATSGGLTTGILRTGGQNITVTSANADYIVCLPPAGTSMIGIVITGQVGANGFELRVQAAQATTVYINGVTTNVEAAIPANTSFEVRCIDTTHWILKAWSADGAELAHIVPDAV